MQRFEENKVIVNDLKMTGLLLQYLLLEELVDLKHVHMAAWCDNTSAVSWTAKMSSCKSMVGQQLNRALALRMCKNKSSDLAVMSIAGADNDMADLASRSFKQTEATGNYNLSDAEFLTRFNRDFPLEQESSWLMLHHMNNVSSLVFTLLRGETPPTGSFLTLKKCGSAIGRTGPTLLGDTMNWTPFLKTHPMRASLTSLGAFMRFVREGHAGREHQVRAPSVQEVLRAVGQTFNMDRKWDPTKERGNPHELQFQLKRQMNGYRNEDPKSSPKLAVPCHPHPIPPPK